MHNFFHKDEAKVMEFDWSGPMKNLLEAHPVPEKSVALSTLGLSNPFTSIANSDAEILESDFVVIKRGDLKGAVAKVLAILNFTGVSTGQYLISLTDTGRNLVVFGKDLQLVQPHDITFTVKPRAITDKSYVFGSK